MLVEALAVMDKTGERVVEAELYRLKGELLLNVERGIQNAEFVHHSSFSVRHSAAECFLKAIDIARRQQAKSWKLRAVMSLARLW